MSGEIFALFEIWIVILTGNNSNSRGSIDDALIENWAQLPQIGHPQGGVAESEQSQLVATSTALSVKGLTPPDSMKIAQR